jgi:hypothetical protein
MIKLKKTSFLLLCIITVLLVGCKTDKARETATDVAEIPTKVTDVDKVTSDIVTEVTDIDEETSDIVPEVTRVNVEVNHAEDIISFEQTYRHYVYLEEIEVDFNEPGSSFFKDLEVISDKKNINIPVTGVVSSMKNIRDKVIIESYPENSNNIAELGLFDPYVNKYKKIGEIPFSAGYGQYSFTMADRYFVMISTVCGDIDFKGSVLIYDIETDILQTVDEFDEYNIVNGITPIGENALAYFYYEKESQDWVVKYYDLSTKKSDEVFRHTNINENNTMSMMAIGSGDDKIVLTVQYIENNIYKTRLEWITKSGDLYKTEEINFDELYGNEYEIKDITVDGDYYFVDASFVSSGTSCCSILKRNNDTLNLISLFYLPKELLSESFADTSNIIYNNYHFDLDGVEGIVVVNLDENKIRTFEFSKKISFEDKVLVNSQGDVIIFYCNDGKFSECQIVEDFNSIDSYPLGGGFPFETFSYNNPYFEERDYYYEFYGYLQ